MYVSATRSPEQRAAFDIARSQSTRLLRMVRAEDALVRDYTHRDHTNPLSALDCLALHAAGSVVASALERAAGEWGHVRADSLLATAYRELAGDYSAIASFAEALAEITPADDPFRR